MLKILVHSALLSFVTSRPLSSSSQAISEPVISMAANSQALGPLPLRPAALPAHEVLVRRTGGGTVEGIACDPVDHINNVIDMEIRDDRILKEVEKERRNPR